MPCRMLGWGCHLVRSMLCYLCLLQRLPACLLFCLVKKIGQISLIWWRREKLSRNAKQWCWTNNTDPYVVAAKDWITDSDALPPLTCPDIVNDLFCGLCAYTAWVWILDFLFFLTMVEDMPTFWSYTAPYLFGQILHIAPLSKVKVGQGFSKRGSNFKKEKKKLRISLHI